MKIIIRYYINSQGNYYTVVGKSNLKADSREAIEEVPITNKDFSRLFGMDMYGDEKYGKTDHDKEGIIYNIVILDLD